jgi:hypothetical protein
VTAHLLIRVALRAWGSISSSSTVGTGRATPRSRILWTLVCVMTADYGAPIQLEKIDMLDH